MITLTLEKSTKLSKHNFVDIEELFDEYRKTSMKKWDYIEIWSLSAKELNKESQEKIARAKTLPNSAFTNI